MQKIKEYSSVEEAVRDIAGEAVTITDRRSVSGGDINRAYALTLSNGQRIFMKNNPGRGLDFFRAEALGLAAIGATNTISVPKVYGIGEDGSGAFLCMEMLETGPKISDFWEVFAGELAAMHRADTGAFVENGRYGFSGSNFIGATPQKNITHDSWISFFREERLLPQIELAKRYFSSGDRKMIDRFLDRLDSLLVEPEAPSLIHGDLWGGNFITGPDGKAWLIDPATYVGSAEADLAMTELFGGFSGAFYEAYREQGLLQPGYRDRKDIYNLYHLLNHLNLFGSGYLSSVMSIVRRYY